jgi:hypothetical protein
MATPQLSISDLQWAIHFLERVVPRGTVEEDRVVATVEALRAEVERRSRRNNGAN